MILPSILLYALVCFLQFAGATTHVRRQQPPRIDPAGDAMKGGVNLIIAAVKNGDLISMEMHLTPVGQHSNRFNTDAYFMGNSERNFPELKQSKIDPTTDKRIIYRLKISVVNEIDLVIFKHDLARSIGNYPDIKSWFNSKEGAKWLEQFAVNPDKVRQAWIDYGDHAKAAGRLGAAEKAKFQRGIGYYDPVQQKVDYDKMIGVGRQRLYYTGTNTETKPPPVWGESSGSKNSKVDFSKFGPQETSQRGGGPGRGQQGAPGLNRPTAGQGFVRPNVNIKPGEYPDLSKFVNTGTSQAGGGPGRGPQGAPGLNRPTAGQGFVRPNVNIKPGEYPDLSKFVNTGTSQAGGGPGRGPQGAPGLNRPTAGQGFVRPNVNIKLGQYPDLSDYVNPGPSKPTIPRPVAEFVGPEGTIIRPPTETSGGARQKSEQGGKKATKKGPFKKFIDFCRK